MSAIEEEGSHLNWADGLVIVVYFSFVLGVGLWVSQSHSLVIKIQFIICINDMLD